MTSYKYLLLGIVCCLLAYGAYNTENPKTDEILKLDSHTFELNMVQLARQSIVPDLPIGQTNQLRAKYQAGCFVSDRHKSYPPIGFSSHQLDLLRFS